MLPSRSFDTLDTWPSVHPFGICGQDGSTTNFGTSTLAAGMGGAAEVRRVPGIRSATTTARTIPPLQHNNLLRALVLAPAYASGPRTEFRVTSIIILLFGFSSNRTASSGS